MTVDVRPPRVEETIQQMAIRLSRVEQKSSSPGTGVGSGIGTDPSVDTITIDGIVVGSTASPATNLVLSSAAFMEDIWIDADWDAPVDGTAANYDVELARKVSGVYQLVQNYHIGVGTSLRMNALEPQQTYGVRVTAINRIGVRSTPLPASNFTDITTGIDATVPGMVTGLTVTSTLRSFVVKWNEVADRDVARGTGQYNLVWALDSGFSSILGDIYTTATIESVLFNAPTTATIYFKVRAIDNSGNAGPFSSTVTGTLGLVVTNDLTATSVTTAKLANLAVDNSKLALLAVDSAQLANSAVTSTKIANLAVGSAAIALLAVGTAQIADASILTAKIGSLAVTTANIADLNVTNGKIANLAIDNAKINDLDAVKITAGTLNANRIAANSLDVNKLTASTLTSKIITLGAGGTLKIGTAPTTGILINDQGIRLYSGGSVKVALDVAGTATFEGNISASTITSSTLTSATINSGTITGTTVRTASSGQRVAMEAGTLDSIKLYSGNGSESLPGRMLVAISGSSLICQIESPRSSGNDWALQNVQSVTGGNGSSCNWLISNGSSTTRASFSLTCTSNGATPSLVGNGISQLYLTFGGGASAEAKLVGSGNYGFLYLYGGGAVATLNVNLGLGQGFHVMNNTNATFQPIQASAFNVSSSRSVKTGIRKETKSALDRINLMEVVRFKRVLGENQVKELPAHIQREINLEEIGLIADDLLAVAPEAVQLDEYGNARSVSLGVLVAILIKSVQELSVKGNK